VSLAEPVAGADHGPGQPVLEARGITKYFGAVTALRGVDFTLYQNEVVGVVGDNGAGKSTYSSSARARNWHR
jgi:ABC-type sugar transport system ATPase subunit